MEEKKPEQRDDKNQKYPERQGFFFFWKEFHHGSSFGEFFGCLEMFLDIIGEVFSLSAIWDEPGHPTEDISREEYEGDHSDIADEDERWVQREKEKCEQESEFEVSCTCGISRRDDGSEKHEHSDLKEVLNLEEVSDTIADTIPYDNQEDEGYEESIWYQAMLYISDTDNHAQNTYKK